MCNTLLQHPSTTQTYKMTCFHSTGPTVPTYLAQPFLTLSHQLHTAMSLLWCLMYLVVCWLNCGKIQDVLSLFLVFTSKCWPRYVFLLNQVGSYNAMLMMTDHLLLAVQGALLPACGTVHERSDGMIGGVCGCVSQLRRGDATTNVSLPRHRLTNCYNMKWLADTMPG